MAVQLAAGSRHDATAAASSAATSASYSASSAAPLCHGAALSDGTAGYIRRLRS